MVRDWCDYLFYVSVSACFLSGAVLMARMSWMSFKGRVEFWK